MLIADILRVKGDKVFTARSDDTVADAVATLMAHNIGALVVLDDTGEVAGILSERDVVRHLATTKTADLLAEPVTTCMTGKPITCKPRDSLDHLMAIMTEHRVRHVPVCEDRTLIGIVSIGDAVKRKIEHTEEEAAALRDYIAS